MNLRMFNNRLFLVVSLITVGLFALAFIVVSLMVGEDSFLQGENDLEAGRKVFEALSKERTKRLITGLQVAAEVPAFRSALKQRPVRFAPLADLMERDLNRAVRGDFFQVTDPAGRLLAEEDSGQVKKIKSLGKDPAAPDQGFAQSLLQDEPRVLSGFLAREGKIFLTVTGPVMVAEKVLGGLRAGYALDGPFCDTLRECTRTDWGFVLDGKVAASSLEPRAERQMEAALKWILAYPTGATWRLKLGSVHYLGRAYPLLDPMGEPSGQQLVLRSLQDHQVLKHRILWLLSLLGLLAELLLAIFANPRLLERMNQPFFGPGERPQEAANLKRKKNQS